MKLAIKNSVCDLVIWRSCTQTFYI